VVLPPLTVTSAVEVPVAAKSGRELPKYVCASEVINSANELVSAGGKLNCALSEEFRLVVPT